MRQGLFSIPRFFKGKKSDIGPESNYRYEGCSLGFNSLVCPNSKRQADFRQRVLAKNKLITGRGLKQ